MIETANLNEATKLFETLGKHIPSTSEIDSDYVKFIGKILDSIQKNEDYSAYLTSIQLMTGITFNVLEKSSSEEILELFISGLTEWRVIELVEFFRDIGYQNG